MIILVMNRRVCRKDRRSKDMLRVITALPLALLVISCSLNGGPNPASGDGTLRRGGDAEIDNAREKSRVPGEYIIILGAGAPADAIQNCLGAFIPVLIRKSATENLRLVIFRKDPGLCALRAILKSCGGIAGIRRNVRTGPETRSR